MFERGGVVCSLLQKESQVNIYYAKSFFYIRTKNLNNRPFSSLFFVAEKHQKKRYSLDDGHFRPPLFVYARR